MTLGELGEFGLLDALGVCGRSLPPGWVGPGDDAAVLPSPAAPLLFTSDLLVEGVHFRLETTSFRDLGYKTLAVNVSDVAAMGGRPLAYVLSVAAPAGLSLADLRELYEGLEEASREFGCPLAGGDTSSGPQLLLSVALLGLAPSRGAVLRKGGRPGDGLYLSGSPGESAAGLRLLEAGASLNSSARRCLAARHRRPTPRLGLGSLLGDRGLATAMIDVSDGLLQDLGHILRQSGRGATLEADRIPVSAALREVAGELGLDPLEAALGGGEDYELLFCAEPGDEERVQEAARLSGVAVTRIGTVTSEPGLGAVRGGSAFPLPSSGGYDHFRSRVGSREVAPGR